MKNINYLLMSIALTLFAPTGNLHAATISKSFEFGAGTASPNSTKRTFNVPCGQKASAAVMFQRGGGSGVPDVELVMELRSPGATPNEEGPVIAGKEISAKPLLQTAVLSGQKSNRGCSSPWVVRVRAKSPPAPVKILGTMALVLESEAVQVGRGFVDSAGRNPSLTKGEVRTMFVGGNDGLQQGVIRLTPYWTHNLITMPIRMKVELINPNGEVVASDTGYSSSEVNPCCSNDKLNIQFVVPDCMPGQWTARFTNLSEHQANFVTNNAKLEPACQ